MRASALAVILLAAGCLDAVEHHAAFGQQRYLCTPEHADTWAAEVAACRAARGAGESCGGLLSMRGRLQGFEVTVETSLYATTLYVAEFDTGVRLLNRLYLNGATPYFFFVLKTYTVGGDMMAPDGDERELVWDPEAYASTASMETLIDDRVGGDFRIETALENIALPVLRVKQDAIPGMEIPVHFTPVMSTPPDAVFPACAAAKECWEIACAQLCGLGHYRMRGFITVHEPGGFEAWLAEQSG